MRSELTPQTAKKTEADVRPVASSTNLFSEEDPAKDFAEESELQTTTEARDALYDRFSSKLETAFQLNRQLVSAQASKSEPIYRWFKYKEGFSSALVKYFVQTYAKRPGHIFDPFAGAGTTLFAGRSLGWKATGIELLPVGLFAMRTRERLSEISVDDLRNFAASVWDKVGAISEPDQVIEHISITKDAFPEETELRLNQYLTYCNLLENSALRDALKFVAFSVLEEISFTRKDGQYLRWDSRSKRKLGGKPFDKGTIRTFEDAIDRKLGQIIDDLTPKNDPGLFPESVEESSQTVPHKPLTLLSGSCLDVLPTIDSASVDFVVTSPPYCNRYDYTRTYALELVFLGYKNEQVRDLRQALLSCTVENKEKVAYLQTLYSDLGKKKAFDKIISAYTGSAAMTEVNNVLEELNSLGKLNNNNIPRMVRNYFLELCFTIYELARISKKGAYCVMVNDNVRYGGEEIPVDLILSEFAESFGYEVEKILVLPRGKGNSSQQMGKHGRTEIRKCVYVWRKK